MIVDFLFVGFLFYLTIPLVAGYAAHCYGRSFWLWFALGALLPAISHMALAFLAEKPRVTNSILTPTEDRYMTRLINELLQEIQSTQNNF